MVFRRIVRSMILSAATLGSSYLAIAQPPTIPTSSGTYSIESEILAYKGLRANSKEIASEIIARRGSRNLILVPSSSTAVPAFQLWRSHMVIVHNFLEQADNMLGDGDGCPGQPHEEHNLSFSGYTTAIGEGVTALQSILSLFSSSQSVNEFTGTIQDQALMLAVARELKKSGVTIVLTPDIYGPSTIATISPDSYPFVKILEALIDEHAALQRAYVCNAMVASATGQLQQAEIARETDFGTLATLGDDKEGQAKAKQTLDDIAKQTALLAFLRRRIGLPQEAFEGTVPVGGIGQTVEGINNLEKDILMQENIVKDTKKSADDRKAAVQAIVQDDVNISAWEATAISQINLKVAQIMSLVTGIESYLSSLTGGSITLTPPTAPSSPTTSTTSQGTAQPAGGQPGATQQGSPAGGPGGGGAAGTPPAPAAATPQTSPSTSSSTPTIVAVLQADGLAAKMGFTLTDDFSATSTQLDQWGIVWLKALESGGSIINEANILGSHPYFGGGAVSAYALYQLDGDLLCSANVASYGGYVKAKDFPDYAADPDDDKTVRSIVIGGNCANSQP